MPSLLEILNDPNYVNANQATKEAIFNKYSVTDPNYTDANDATKEAIKKRFGMGVSTAEVFKPTDTRKAEEVGAGERIGTSLKRGFSALGDVASGLGLAGTSVFGTEEETAKKMAAIKRDAAEEARGTKTLTASDIQRIAEEKGYISAGAKVPSYIVEQILQSAPSMAIPLAVGAGAAAVSGPLAPIVGPVAGITAYGVQQFGNFLARQAQEKEDPKELELAKAALTAGGTAPIGYFADRFTTGLSSIGTKKAMSEVYSELGKRGVAGEVGKRAAKGAAIGIVAEAPTEVLEAVAERYQAGLPIGLDDPDAANEYKEAFFGAAAAGGGIGAGARAIGAYGEYKQAVRAEDALGQVRSEKNAFQEAEEEDAGVDTGIDKQGVPISDQQELDIAAGVRDAGPGDLEGNQLPPSPIGEREVAVDNQLNEKIKEAQAYIRELQAIDPNDPRIEDAVAYIQQLQNPQAFNAPGQTPAEAYTNAVVSKYWQKEPLNPKVSNLVSALNKQNIFTDISGDAYRDNYIYADLSIPQHEAANLKLPNGWKVGPAMLPEQLANRKPRIGETSVGPYNLTRISKETNAPVSAEEAQQIASIVKEYMDKTGVTSTPSMNVALNAPGIQQGFEFAPADETTQRAVETEMTETPGFALQQESGALPTGEVAPIEEVTEEPKAKMMLIGEGANPLAPLKSFLKSLKTATNAPQQVRDYNAEINNMIEDISEFIGETTQKVARYREEGAPAPVPPTGPDVAAPTPGVQRNQRLNFLDNFFNSLSNVPAGQENLTGTLSQRLAGMNLNDQMQVLGQLTNVPNINTVRGVRDLRAKLGEAMTAFEGQQIGEPVEKAAVYKGDETQSNAVRRAITILKNIPAKLRTPEENAAMVYFERWGFAMAMRSAAFDLGSKPNKLITGPIFKGQNNAEAQLFQDWVKENLPPEEASKFEATVNEFKAMTARAEQLEDDAERVAKGRGVVARVTQPTGKVSEGFKKDAGLAKDRQPSSVSKLEAQRFYPMHPAMQQAIEEGNLDAALSVLERSGNKFYSGLAKRLRSLGLQTAVVFDQQAVLAEQILTTNYKGQLDAVFGFVQATDKALFDEYFSNPSDYAKVKAGLDKITDKSIEGQVEQLKAGYESALNMLQSSGTYVQGLDVINLNKQQGGASNYTFLHELVHATTVYSLAEVNFDKLDKQQQAAVTQLKELYEFSKRTGLNEYGFKNVEEFVAEAFSNETFQDILKAIPYKAGQEQFRTEKPALVKAERKEAQGALELEEKTKEKPQSMWDKFTELVAKLFKMNNVLGYTLANANVIMQAPPAFTSQAAAFNAQSKRSVLAGTMPTAPGFIKFLDRIYDGKSTWEKVKGTMPYVLQDMSDTLRKRALGALTLRQLNDLVGNNISQFRAFISKSEAMLDETNRILHSVKGVSDKWRLYKKNNPEKSNTLSKLMIDATRMGLDPNNTTGTNLDKAWAEIGPDGQAIFNEVRQFYKKQLDAYIESVIEAKKSAYRTTLDENDPVYKAESAEIEKQPDVVNLRNYFKRHSMPVYFPLRRFGDYSLQIGKGDKKEFYLFESAAQRNAATRELLKKRAAEGRPVDKSEVFQGNSRRETSTKLQDFEFYKELQDLIDAGTGHSNAELKQDIKDRVEQLYFMLLPDQSVRKAFMNRQDVPGMSEDMLRAFESSATHIAYQHSRFKYAPVLYSLIDSADRDVKAKGLEGTIERDYVNELDERLKLFMNPPEANALTRGATSLSFLWYMSAPASAIVNMLGVPAIGLPVLAARYNWGASSAKISEYVKKFSSTGFRNQLGERAFPSLSNKPEILNDLQRRAFDQLVAEGLFDMTLTHDILDKANRSSNAEDNILDKVSDIVGAPFHAAEKFNREVLGMATFDLAYAKAKKDGYSDAAAFKKAISDAKELTYRSMFDYSTLNKPRYFQNQYAKVVLQFKQFSQQMTYLLARSAYEGIAQPYTPEELGDVRIMIKNDHNKNKPNLPPLTDAELDAAVAKHVKEVQLEARNRLAGTLGMTFVFAGATGLPLWSMLTMTMNALQAAIGEDDEEWDFNNWFKNWASETFGGFVGDSLSRGLITQTIGADLSSRMSLNDLWFRDQRKNTDEVTYVQNLIISMLGPSMGLVINSAEAVKQLNDGHIQRAMETASPAVVKNIMKGMRYEVEGRAVNLKGDELIGDVSSYESIVQGIGFSPERVAQRQKSNIEMKAIEQKVMNKRQDLLNAYFMAVDNDDSDLEERVVEKIIRFNNAYGEVGITGEQLQKSVTTRYKNRALAEETGGISINKKLINRLSELQEYGNP